MYFPRGILRCLYTCWMPVYLWDVCIPVACCPYTCRMPILLDGPVGPNGSQAKLGQWSQQVPGPIGPMGPTGPGPNWVNGPNRSQAQLGQAKLGLWAKRVLGPNYGNLSVLAFSGRITRHNKIDMAIHWRLGGVTPTGKWFRLVCACVRVVWL